MEGRKEGRKACELGVGGAEVNWSGSMLPLKETLPEDGCEQT